MFLRLLSMRRIAYRIPQDTIFKKDGDTEKSVVPNLHNGDKTTEE